MKSVRDFFPDSKFHVFFSEWAEFQIDDPNVHFHNTNFDFEKNLNGKSFILNQINIYKKIAKNCDYIAKIDSDVLMFDGDFSNYFDEQYDFIGKFNEIQLNQGQKEYAFGGFNLIKSEFLLNLNKIARQLDKQSDTIFKNEAKWAEDQRMSALLLANNPKYLLQRETKENERSLLGFWRYDLYDDNIPIGAYSSLVQDFHCVEFGRLSRLSADYKDRFKIRDSLIKKIYKFKNGKI